MTTKKQEPLRLMIYDATQRTGLSQSWFVGGALYENMRWLDDCQGFDSWEKALTWVVDSAAMPAGVTTRTCAVVSTRTDCVVSAAI